MFSFYSALRHILVLFLSILCLSTGAAGRSAPARSAAQNASSIIGWGHSHSTKSERRLMGIQESLRFPFPSTPRSPPRHLKIPPPPPVAAPIFPPVGSFSSITTLPSNSWDAILVSSDGSSIFVSYTLKQPPFPSELYHSQDAGQTWQRVPRPNLIRNWSSLRISKSSIILFIHINDTLWKSYDVGGTWKEASPIPCFQPGGNEIKIHIVEKELAPSDDGSTIWAYYTNTKNPYYGGIRISYEERICVSRDGGWSWTTCTSCSVTNTTSTIIAKPLSIPFPFSPIPYNKLSISGDGSLLAYNSVAKGVGLVSLDTLEVLPSFATWPISFSYNGSTVLGAFNLSLWLSNDRGATFGKLNTTNEYGIVFARGWTHQLISSDGTRLIAISSNVQSDTVCLRSLDAGLTWTSSQSPRSYIDKFWKTAGNSDLSNIWATPAFGGISKSTDFGTTWGEYFEPTELQVSPDGLTVMAGNWLTTNEGSTWRKMDGDKNGAAICAEGRFLLATQNSTIYLSRDGGSTWKYLAYFARLRRIVASMTDCKRIVAVSGMNITHIGTHISKDMGKTWSSRVANISTNGWWFTMSASWDAKKIATSWGVLTVSTNGGNTWTRRNPSNYSSALFPSFSGDGSRLLVGVAFPGRLLLSLNDGADWQLVLPAFEGYYYPPTVQGQLASSYDGRIMYAVNSGKFLRSNTGGTTWQVIDFPSLYITALGTSKDGRIVYILDAGAGIYASQDFGSNWISVGPNY